MLSKELIIFSRIESCLTHRCSKVFLPFKVIQKRDITVTMKRQMRKGFLLLQRQEQSNRHDKAFKWALVGTQARLN